MYQLPYVTPEKVGLPSEAVLRFMKRLDSYQVPVHSVIISRYNKICTEAYYSPYENNTLHRMFSITKSFTSIAIGLLAEEGQISLDDPIVNYFQDKIPNNLHPWIASMTIRDMLRMETCHRQTTYKINPERDWVGSFFDTEPTHPPGSLFIYDTSSSHTLCALVERLTGKPMLDYLRDKFLDNIGFSREAYIIPDPFGVSMGGSGLMATPMDIMKFGVAIMNSLEDEAYNKRQNREGNISQGLLPSFFIKEAISHQTDTMVRGAFQEECLGYGYQFWITRHGGFAAYGMGGQLLICLPKYDLICVTTADTQGIQGGNQLIYNCLYEEILTCLSDSALPENSTAVAKLNDYIKSLSIKPIEGGGHSPLVEKIHGKQFSLKNNAAGFEKLSLEFKQETKEGKVLIYRDKENDKEILKIPFGFGKMVISQFPIYNQRTATSGAWLQPNVLYVKSHIIDECISSVHIQLVFNNDNLTVYMKKTDERSFGEFNGFLHGELDYLNGEKI